MAEADHESGLDEFDYDGDDTHDATTEEPAETAAPAEDAAANGTAEPETATAVAEVSAEDAAAGKLAAADAPAAAPQSVPDSGAAVSTDPNDPANQPPHGSDVFIGGIPKELTDEQLREFASPAGEVHSVSISKDPSTGLSKGFGFVKYMSKEAADKAKTTLNGTPLKDFPETKVRVLPSQAKNRLYVGNIPRALTHEQLVDILKPITKGFQTLELVKSKDVPGQNRGFCFVEFLNSSCAAHAKSALSPPGYTMQGRSLTITFAEPRFIEQGAAPGTAEIKSVFVGKLPESATEEKLQALFSGFGEIEKVTIPAAREDRPRREFGFVHFKERSSAVSVVESGETFTLDGNELNIKYGRPQVPAEQLQAARGGFAGRGGFNARGRGRGGMGGGFGYGAGMGMGMGGGMGEYYDDGSGYGMGMDAYGGHGGYGMDAYGGGYGVGGGMGMGGGIGMGGGGIGGMAGAGMSMVPMMLPNGQVGYVLANATAGMAAGMGGGMGGMGAYGTGAGMSGGAGPVRTGRGMSPRGRGAYGRGGSHRYTPY